MKKLTITMSIVGLALAAQVSSAETADEAVFQGKLSVKASKYDAAEEAVVGPASVTGTFSYSGEVNTTYSYDSKTGDLKSEKSTSKVATAKMTNKTILDAMGLGKGYSIVWVADDIDDPKSGSFYAYIKGSKNSSAEYEAIDPEMLSICSISNTAVGINDSSVYGGSKPDKVSKSGKGVAILTAQIGTTEWLVEEANGSGNYDYKFVPEKGETPEYTSGGFSGSLSGNAGTASATDA